jgi:hypothetical protein
VLSLFRRRLYQFIAGYGDANDADRLRYDPVFQILADRPLVNLSVITSTCISFADL